MSESTATVKMRAICEDANKAKDLLYSLINLSHTDQFLTRDEWETLSDLFNDVKDKRLPLLRSIITVIDED